MMMHRTLVLVALLAVVVSAQDWPHWRGPSYDGSAKATNLPTDFSKKKGVLWAADMPGPGACTPIVVGDRIFLSSVDAKRDKLVAMCLDRKTGKALWKHDAGSGFGGGSTGGRRSNYASPSPTTDGKRVIFFFGNGDLVAYGVDGKLLWRRNIQKDHGNFAFLWTFSASPTLWDGKVFLPILQRDTPVGRGGGRGRGRGSRGDDTGARAPIDSFVLALDPETGKPLYKQSRPSQARAESRECYATMIPFTNTDGRKEMLCVGGDVLTGHDPETGKELWRWGTWNEGHRQRAWRLVPSVVSGSGVALVCAPKRAPVFAVKLGGSGEISQKTGLAWQSEGRSNPVSSDVPTPAYADGNFYVLSDVRSALSKVDAKTGKVAWTVELPSDYRWRSSPTYADGKVWFIDHNGLVVVVDAATGKVVKRAWMGESEDDDQIRSSVVVAHGCLFIRTNAKLFCIGK